MKIVRISVPILIFITLMIISPAVFGAGLNPPDVRVSRSTEISQSNGDLDKLRIEIEKLRDENYQNIIRASQAAISKTDSLIGEESLFATIFGVVLAVVTAVLGLGFFSVRQDLREELRDLRSYVKKVEQNAEMVERLTSEARNQVEKILPRIVNDYQNAKNKMQKLLTEAEKGVKNNVGDRKVDKELKEWSQELSRAIKDAQKRETELADRLLKTTNNIQAMNSQASALSGTTVFQPVWFPGIGTPRQNNFIDVNPYSGLADKCSQCNRIISPDEISLNLGDDPTPYLSTGPILCNDCKKKASVNQNKNP